jgi:hypothetical protein
MALRTDPQLHSGTDPWKAERWPARPPVIDAREGGESAWELWQEASRRLDLAFAPTEPSSAAPMATESGTEEPLEISTRSHLLNAHSLMVLARRNNRVCPRPALWTQLYQLLDGERHPHLQAPPVQAWLWPKLSGLQKRLRFREHVEWAERHGRLEQVARFMGALAETDWVQMGEA